jgi:glycosyltransferase involved in cell wall biosynthesis
MRIGLVAPVAQALPPRTSGSVELVTALLADGLVARGHRVTLFATTNSTSRAEVQGTFAAGYAEDVNLWPWEFCELLNVAGAVERAAEFDLIHAQAEYYPAALAFSRLSPVPVLQTVHHAPSRPEVALWSKYPEAPFVAISRAQARLLDGLTVVGIAPHGIDMSRFAARDRPDDYCVFLGRFTEGKGVLQAIEVARRAGVRLLIAAPENEYYHQHVKAQVDGRRVRYVGEVDHARKVELLSGARALLYPVQAAEPFGLVLVEAMACGTPVAALDRGAVSEVVDDGVTGRRFDSLDALVAGLPAVMALDRRTVRAAAVERHGVDRMVGDYEQAYRRLLGC